jgi:uncharacterized protein
MMPGQDACVAATGKPQARDVSTRHALATESDIDLMVLLEGPVDAAQEIRRMWEVLYPLQIESARLLSVMPVDAALYDQGAYALYRQVKADGMAL